MTLPTLFPLARCRLPIALLVLLLGWLWPVPTGRAGAPQEELSRSQHRWVERTLARMTREEKVGQLLMIPYYGGFANTESEEFRRL
ncbi:hypothetical protein MYX77_12065, partial [Acidobacteriia bacterium AH_259_A11_L15]|nr:hypothetical protein [Acidobacteriia bacterium AH_259_A11_L15]